MEISNQIIEEAKAALSNNLVLPIEMKCAPRFFLALHSDDSIHAFGAIEVAGIYYKIGVLKPQS